MGLEWLEEGPAIQLWEYNWWNTSIKEAGLNFCTFLYTRFCTLENAVSWLEEILIQVCQEAGSSSNQILITLPKNSAHQLDIARASQILPDKKIVAWDVGNILCCGELLQRRNQAKGTDGIGSWSNFMLK